MSIYCLDSYKDALDQNKDFIFEMNKLSLEFFEGKFNVPYQFPKYDTVFCH
jgi:aminopeptidase N